ncbi:MAG TPA: hypothetical protein DEA62_04170 [Coxiellaceae bacterium]|nr:hypothetical protein [Coxiellaceae bacterium]
MQFEALNKIAPSSLFQKEAAFRAKILEHNYPLVYRRYNDKYQILLNKGGSPHPFIIDTYPIKITCSSNDGAKIENNVKEQLVTPNDTNDTNNRFVVIQTLFRPESCKVESVLPNKDPILYRSYLLYKSKPIFFSSNEIVKILKYDLSAAYNAKKISEKNILISPSHKSKPSEPDNYVNNQGRIILKKINIAELESFIGLELYSKKEVNLGMGLIDNSGEEFFRYYPKLKGESWNLVLLTPVGFNNVEKAKLPFKAINIYIYTHNLHCDPFVINIGDLWTANFQQSFALFHRITSKYNFVVP